MRRPEVVLIAGRNGTGKTTLARRLVSGFSPAHVGVVSPTGEWGAWEADVRELTRRYLRRGVRVLVLDDSDAYVASDDAFWRRLLATNRHLGLDVLLLSRRPQSLPLWAVAAATRAYLLPLGPREADWCERRLGAAPPREGYVPTFVAL